MTTAAPSVLFVDDDPNVLQGLRRMLHHKRQAWRMAFATSGRQALEMMAQAPVDVLVSDMRMPEMDGAALLMEAAKRHPDTVRFILSGQSSKEALFRAVGPCHQFLSKPCEGKVLEERVEGALALRRRLSDAPLRAVIGKLHFLPTPPAAFHELQTELDAGQPQQERVEAILGRAPGIAAKLLQMANSAYFQRGREIRSLWQAVNFLGYDVVRSLAVHFGIAGQIRRADVAGVPNDDFFNHTSLVAGLARAIARSERLPTQSIEDSFSAGILHDVGAMILAENFAEKYAALASAAATDGIPLHEAERVAFGVTHADVGGYLLGTWGLPDSLVLAVADHHRPTNGNEPLDAAAAVRIADSLVCGVERRGIDGPAAKLAALDAGRRQTWCALRDRMMEGRA